MKNQHFTGTPTSRRFALCPTTVKAGDVVLIGTQPAIALDDYATATTGTTFLLNGSFDITVNAWKGTSPLTGPAIKPCDKGFFNGGVLDSPTNVTTGGTISKNSGGTFFGRLDPENASVGSGLTATAAVEIGME